MKYVLGIESTAHTFGASVIDVSKDGKDKSKMILSNVRDSVTTTKGGMVPNKAMEHHVEVCDEVINKALEEANKKIEENNKINKINLKKLKNISIKDIDLISFSSSPGLGGCLRVGAICARTLSLKNKIPIIGVNHCIAHLEIGKILTNAKDPVLLYCSGANTQIIAFEGDKYRIFGESLDTGIGNFLDTFARDMELGFPGGPKIEKLALLSKNYIELPYSVKGMDVAFSGMLSNLKEKLTKKEKDKNGNEIRKYKMEDLAYSAQETAFAMLVEVAERAMAHCEKKELLLGGGVACNKRLQAMCKIMCDERRAKFYCPQNDVLIDNAVMIAWLGYLEYKSGIRMDIDTCPIDPYLRTDEVVVGW